MTSKNGRLLPSELATITGTTRRCRIDVVGQTVALRAAFEAHFGKPLIITDAYRDFDEQVVLKKAKGVFAATPGTSNHGWGLALDLGAGVNTSFTSPEHLWMVDHASDFGYFHPSWAHDHKPSNGQDEPWHWETRGAVPVTAFISRIPDGVLIPDTSLDVLGQLIPEEDMANVTDDQLETLIRAAERLLTNIEPAVARLDDRLGAQGETTGKVDRILQGVVDIRGGLEGLPSILDALDGLTEAELNAISVRAQDLADARARARLGP